MIDRIMLEQALARVELVRLRARLDEARDLINEDHERMLLSSEIAALERLVERGGWGEDTFLGEPIKNWLDLKAECRKNDVTIPEIIGCLIKGLI